MADPPPWLQPFLDRLAADVQRAHREGGPAVAARVLREAFPGLSPAATATAAAAIVGWRVEPVPVSPPTAVPAGSG